MLIPMSIAALLQSPRHESKLIIHQLISKEDVVYKYIINNICVYIHTYNGILFSHINKKTTKILPFATTLMDPDGILLSEIC